MMIKSLFLSRHCIAPCRFVPQAQCASAGMRAILRVMIFLPPCVTAECPARQKQENQKVLFPCSLADASCAEDTAGKIGDGIITVNPSLIPTVTVADCDPLFLWEPRTGVFGIVHSGWKGTGIVADALALAAERYGANASDFFIAIGPHIRECCYCVDEERADYFARNFSSDCVTPLDDAQGPKIRWNTGGGKAFRLSLERANLALLKKIGVQERRITLCTDCTCCNPVFGSNRRETIATGCQDNFTVMAAFIIKPS